MRSMGTGYVFTWARPTRPGENLTDRYARPQPALPTFGRCPSPCLSESFQCFISTQRKKYQLLLPLSVKHWWICDPKLQYSSKVQLIEFLSKRNPVKVKNLKIISSRPERGTKTIHFFCCFFLFLLFLLLLLPLPTGYVFSVKYGCI